MRILLVEDEPDLGAVLERSLKREKYVVDWVTDGTQAWQFLESLWNQYTVAIFDWLLPGLSGIELCQRLRAQQHPLPVLMLAAKDQLSDRVIGLDAGADDYLIKPFGMAELLGRLRALQRRSPKRSPGTIKAVFRSKARLAKAVYSRSSSRSKKRNKSKCVGFAA